MAAGEALRGRDLSRLASAVLQEQQAALALHVLDGGNHTPSKAGELARLILEAAARESAERRTCSDI